MSSESDAKEIEQRFREWADLEVKGDLTSWLEFVAEDAVLQPPGEPAVQGKIAIEKWIAKFFELPISAMEPTNLTVHVSTSGDLACNFGNLRMALNNPDGVVEYDLKCLAVWRKIEGCWLLTANSWSSNTP